MGECVFREVGSCSKSVVVLSGNFGRVLGLFYPLVVIYGDGLTQECGCPLTSGFIVEKLY